jgi:hypothetical protein
MVSAVTPKNRYMIELRRPLRRKRGWTQWSRWMLCPTLEMVEADYLALDWWLDMYDGQARVVDRETGKPVGEVRTKGVSKP